MFITFFLVSRGRTHFPNEQTHTTTYIPPLQSVAYKRRRQTHSSFLLGDPCLKKKNKQTQKFFSFNFCDLIGENQCVYIPFIFSVPRRGVNNTVHGHVFLRLLEDLYFYRTRKTWRWDIKGRFDTTTFLVWGLSREDLSDPTTRSEVCSRR